jgi:hypothetical protein
MMKAGLLAACFGAALLAFSSFRGVVTGFDHHHTRLAAGESTGWLAIGACSNILHVRRTPHPHNPRVP